MAVDQILEGGESHFLDLVGEVGATVGLAHGPLAGADEFANLRNGDHIVVDDGCHAVDDLGLLALSGGDGYDGSKAGNGNGKKSSHRLGIVSRKLNTLRSLKSGSGTVKRGNLPPIKI